MAHPVPQPRSQPEAKSEPKAKTPPGTVTVELRKRRSVNTDQLARKLAGHGVPDHLIQLACRGSRIRFTVPNWTDPTVRNRFGKQFRTMAIWELKPT